MSRSNLEGYSILLVEDEPLIAMDIADELEGHGARVHNVPSVDEALTILASAAVSAAVLDYRLADGTADELCQRLTDMGIPFVIYSGYTEVEGVCGKWGVIRKPAAPNALVGMVIARLQISSK
ncbi:protein of unknown function [Candidatus Filomicrobium marinum]|uniref:Response regulatory domain-containing protein n=2 Tax=Filomicrobium TaxID=119044 RepID=A0A0D6JAI6_9HYPH|nr:MULTISPECIES: response regulator [Filomicrobium]MCV0368516.1 response regulator [Filomicrobium sp.]CFX02246.1 protein of unknown function [Candidatus Filomicrobium marinum]CPR15607.1 protein of unknown function [Candidatus Filomicrobium marinum]SDO61863.1 Response regulator receiver domain-containing protein [Filomicrobium insigne]